MYTAYRIDGHGYVVKALVVPSGVLYKKTVCIYGLSLIWSIFTGQNRGPHIRYAVDQSIGLSVAFKYVVQAVEKRTSEPLLYN